MSREAAPAHGEADLPARIGRYVVLRRLGHGAMGIVYAAFDDLLDRKVAIKILRDRGEGSRAFMRVLREAQALARLSHPNVVTVHDVDASAGRVYIAMEFVVGTTLKAWLKERPRRLPETLGVFVQAGRGLAAAHAVGLVHRDFKPENVMVGADGRVRVTDFGLACAARQNAVAPAVVTQCWSWVSERNHSFLASRRFGSAPLSSSLRVYDASPPLAARASMVAARSWTVKRDIT